MMRLFVRFDLLKVKESKYKKHVYLIL